MCNNSDFMYFELCEKNDAMPGTRYLLLGKVGQLNTLKKCVVAKITKIAFPDFRLPFYLFNRSKLYRMGTCSCLKMVQSGFIPMIDQYMEDLEHNWGEYPIIALDFHEIHEGYQCDVVEISMTL